MVVYDFKKKLSALGVIKQVLGANTYSVDCGNGPQHVSGDALSKSSLDAEEVGEPRLTAQEDNRLVQEDAHESDVTVSDSDSSDEDDYGHDLVPAAVPRRRRRVRQLDLGPICPTRLRQRR